MTDLITAYKNFINCDISNIKPSRPASEQEITDFTQTYKQENNMPPPEEILQLALIAKTVTWDHDNGGDYIDLLSEVNQEPGPAFTRAVNLIPDGCGNSFIVDVTSDGKLGPVLFNSHDPIGVAVNSTDLASFFKEQLSVAQKNNAVSSVADIISTLFEDKIDLGLSYEQVMAGSDKVLKTYAKKVGSDNLFVDFRKRTNGLSFHYYPTRKEPMARDWPAVRDGDNLIFAIPLIEHPPTIVQRIKSLFGK